MMHGQTKIKFLWKTQFLHFSPYFLSPHSAICCLKINKYLMYIYIFPPTIFRSFLIVKIWSTVDLPIRKPSWYPSIIFSTKGTNFTHKIFAIILYDVNSNMTALYPSHNNTSPFLWIDFTMPYFHLCGTISS